MVWSLNAAKGGGDAEGAWPVHFFRSFSVIGAVARKRRGLDPTRLTRYSKVLLSCLTES